MISADYAAACQMEVLDTTSLTTEDDPTNETSSSQMNGLENPAAEIDDESDTTASTT